jgi:hypothetical protein
MVIIPASPSGAASVDILGEVGKGGNWGSIATEMKKYTDIPGHPDSNT